MRYDGHPSHSLLSPKDLRELEALIVKDFDSPREMITVIDRGFSKTYSKVDDLLNDPLRPKLVDNFHWEVYSADQRTAVKLSYYELRISGAEGFAKSKAAALNDFLKKHRSLPIAVLKASPLWIIAILVGFGVAIPAATQSPPMAYLAVAGAIVCVIGAVGLFAGTRFGSILARVFLVLEEDRRFWLAEIGLALAVGIIATIIATLLLSIL